MRDKISLNKDNCKILICCHKPCELPPNPDGLFLPVQVGAAISDVDLGMQRDDQVNCEPCDNISAKNKSYCELTALYWAWKNIKKLYPNLEYIGLNHYRRYFSFDEKNYFKVNIEKNIKNINQYKIDIKRLERVLKKENCILCKKQVFPYTVELQYCHSHISSDFNTIKKIIKEGDYREYFSDFETVLCNNNKISFCNMFIMKYEDFEKYCKWIFSILSEAEKVINISMYDQVQCRVFGYLAERLLNVYSYHNFRKIHYFNIIMYVDNLLKGSKLNELKKFLKDTLGFRIYAKSIGIRGFMKFILNKTKHRT